MEPKPRRKGGFKKGSVEERARDYAVNPKSWWNSANTVTKPERALIAEQGFRAGWEAALQSLRVQEDKPDAPDQR